LDTAHGFSLRLRIRRVAPLADVRAINSGWKMRLGCEMVMEWAGLIHSTCSKLQVNAKCLKYAKRKSAECAGGELNAELLTQVWTGDLKAICQPSGERDELLRVIGLGQ